MRKLIPVLVLVLTCLVSTTHAANIILNPGFELGSSGSSNWQQASSDGYPSIGIIAHQGHNSSNGLAVMGVSSNIKALIYQDVTLPASASSATLDFYYQVQTKETTNTDIKDFLVVQIYDPPTSTTPVTTGIASNLDYTVGSNGWNLTASNVWRHYTGLDLISYKGKTIRLSFGVITDSSNGTMFLIDDVNLDVLTGSVNGTCGNSNGATFAVAPSTNLCTTGTASSVTGSTSWSWSCSGNNGGTTASCTAQLTGGSVNLTTGLVGYWNFDDPTNIGHDSSGLANHGVPTSTDVSYVSTGVSGGAAKFVEGVSNSAIRIPYNSSLASTNTFSISAWVKLDGIDTDFGNAIISKEGSTSGSGTDYNLWVNSHGSGSLLGVSAWVGSEHNINGVSGALPNNKWKHIALTYDGSYVKIYVDSVLSGTTAATSAARNQGYDVLIGISPVGGAEDFSGLMDEVRLYNRALTSTEITQLYNVQSSTSLSGNCGSSNGGAFTTAPTTGLCSTGTASAVTGTGPWSWSCTGSGGGTIATCAASSSGGSGSSLNDGLVAYYPFDGNANDASGNGHNGMVYGATLVADKNGTPNKAYYFNGISDYIYWGKVLPDMTEMTMAAWVNSENGNTIVCDGDWAIGNDLVLKVYNSSILARADKNGYTLAQWVPVSSITNGVWRHIVWVMTSAETKVYVDGLFEGAVAVGGSNVGFHNFIVGTEEYPQGSLGWAGYWKGTITELRVYNRSLTSAEISQLYNGQTSSITNGICGSSNGQSYTTTPITNLCSNGAASSLTGTGPWY